MILIAAGVELVLIAFLLTLMIRRHRRLREAEIAALRAAARMDSLTGLENHRSFHDDLTVAMQARTQRGATFALMAVDLDGLKRINDTRGHQAGDEYLRQASRFLRQAVGDAGTVYRTGGDEFMALLPDRRSWHALAAARTLDHLTRSAFGRRAVSIGVTESTGTESRHRLIQQADIALYDAKRGDVTTIVFYPTSPKNATIGTAAPTHQETLVAALARAVDAKDAGTSSHSETVASLVVAIGERLGLRGERLERLRRAGLLHDVGKIGIADRILKKPTSLHAEEQHEMKAHVTIGHTILDANDMRLEATWVLHHHERWDGGGYPDGLRGTEIPVESRILAVADAFEAMTGTRPYQRDMPVADALVELERHAGAQFDRRCVEALCNVMRRGQPDRLPSSATSAGAHLVAMGGSD
jgi:diguanylate cyclase (GGDEF)-like protein